MPESLGSRLRQRREAQHVELATIAAQTKIKLSLLQSLERDDVSQWPAGIFRRAYIRTYAQAIGLDPDVVVREFLEVHPEPVEPVENPLSAAAANGSKSDGGPRTRLRMMVASAFDSLSRSRSIDPPAAPLPPAPAPAPEDVATTAAPSPEPPPPAPAAVPPAVPPPRPAPQLDASSEPDLLAVAQVCTELGRVETSTDMQRLLGDVARILDARGLIVWMWDGVGAELRAALAHGYSERVLAKLPAVSREADNATAVAFRTEHPCAIEGGAETSGALAVPILTPPGCAGVLAIELPPGRERSRRVRAVATIFAAMLAQLVGGTPPEDAECHADHTVHANS